MRPLQQSKAAGSQAWCWWEGQGGAGTASCLPGAKNESTSAETGVKTSRRGSVPARQLWDPGGWGEFWPLLPNCWGLSGRRGEVSAPPQGGGRTGPGAWVPPGTWKMPVPWFLLSFALGPSPVVLSLERLVGPQDAAHCSPVSLGPQEGWRRLRVQSEAQQGPSLAPVTAVTTRTALAGLSGTDGVRGEWGGGKSWVCRLWEGLGMGSPRKR